MIPGDTGKETETFGLQFVAADTTGDIRPSQIEVILDEPIRERTHLERDGFNDTPDRPRLIHNDGGG